MRAIYSFGKQNEKITHKERIPGSGRPWQWGWWSKPEVGESSAATRKWKQQLRVEGSLGERERERERVNVDFGNQICNNKIERESEGFEIFLELIWGSDFERGRQREIKVAGFENFSGVILYFSLCQWSNLMCLFLDMCQSFIGGETPKQLLTWYY